MADTIDTLITGIQTSKGNIATAIENKGVTVPSGTKLAGMATLINQISVMHGPSSSTDGNIAAFDGNIPRERKCGGRLNKLRSLDDKTAGTGNGACREIEVLL